MNKRQATKTRKSAPPLFNTQGDAAMNYTYSRRFAAHLGDTGGVVTIPDQIADDQKGADAAKTIFPAVDGRGNELQVRLDGAAYGLHTSGTGDCVVVEVETE